jgi:uncharacterized protein YbjT (DUF2867 family)
VGTAMTIAVIGATGNTGRAVVKELRALGQNLGADAKTAFAELTDRPALEKALAAVQRVFVVTAHDAMVLPFAKDLPVTLIDVRDTGAVGARIRVEPAPHAGKTYELTGKLTTWGAFAKVFSQALGRPIAYVGITPEQAEQGMKSRGMSDWLVAHNVALAKVGAAGGFSTENIKPIEDLVGRAPITTKQFVEDFKAAFS